MNTCLTIGAGMAGLTAANRLQEAGWAVRLVDKGRGVGGRLATRRIGEARVDHGAQFFTVRDGRFRAAVEQWEREGLVAPWFAEGGHTRYWVRGGMNALARHLARGLEIRSEAKAVRAERGSGERGWRVVLETGEAMESDMLILTAPAPQSLALLPPGVPEMAATLGAIDYDPCFALLLTLEGASRVPEPGYVRPDSGPIEWVADNRRKGVSEAPAVTIHARGDFTRRYLNASPDQVERLLLEAAEPYLGAAVVEKQVHRWLYSKPLPVETPPCLWASGMAVAGDAFCGGRVEGAFLSGLAAAVSGLAAAESLHRR